MVTVNISPAPTVALPVTVGVVFWVVSGVTVGAIGAVVSRITLWLTAVPDMRAAVLVTRATIDQLPP